MYGSKLILLSTPHLIESRLFELTDFRQHIYKELFRIFLSLLDIATMPLPSTARPIRRSLVHHSVFSHFLDDSKPGYIGHWPGTVPAFIDAVSGTTISRSETRALSLSLAFGLRNHPGIRAKRGDTALLYSPNSLAWPILVFGSIAAGLRTSFANNAYTSHELAFQYQDSGANVIFTTEEGLPTVRQMFQEIGVLGGRTRRAAKPSFGVTYTFGGPTFSGSLQKEELFDGRAAHETAVLCYSSGTTGKPKGVEVSQLSKSFLSTSNSVLDNHQNLTSVTDMVMVALPDLSGGASLGILPFYHIYGAVKLIFFSLRAGLPTVIMQRFDPEQYCANVERYKITFSLIVPPVLVVLARHPAVSKYNMTSLKLVFSGAAPLGAALTQQVTDRLRSVNVKCPILQGYGLTETSPTTHLIPYKQYKDAIGSIGTLLPNLEARLVDEDGVDVKAGEPGELWVRGPTIMKGYLNNPSATKNSITSDGWFQTGDVAIRKKSGLYYIVDRRKELIKYKGFQVPPAELESVLLSHPDIADAAVIGIYDEAQATELPRAYIVPADPKKVATDAQKAKYTRDVAKWIQGQVARHKFLRGGVVVIDVVPKSAAGKILRRELRDRAKTEVVATATVTAKYS
ncbi:AMP binding protein [Hymenopellis radicata]|nr:AMP binding protein [Hymenopellis radicata]